MMLSDDVLAWVRLARAPGLDSSALAAALEPPGVRRTPSSRHLRRSSNAPASARRRANSLLSAHALSAAEQRWLGDARHHLLPFTDPRYPMLLHALPDRPIALYVAGNLDALCAIRSSPWSAAATPRPQGSDTAFEFAHYLAERGLGIVSGLAQGIDAAAHRGALAAQGITLAVLGSGLDVIYPRGHRALSEAIRTARRTAERVSAGNCAAARQFSAAQPHHRRVESRDLGGRGGAQERLPDHRRAGPMSSAGRCSRFRDRSTIP